MTADQELCSAFLEAMEQGRIAHGGFQDGRVIDLRGPEAPKVLYLVGDVHARSARIHDVFRHADLHQQLASGEAVVVLLGDLFHREEAERAGEMDSSLDTFREMMSLKIAYPRAFYVLLGNHEFTRTLRCKHGFFQGVLFGYALEQAGLREVYDRFMEASPLVVTHPHGVGVHAAPARSVSDFEELKNLPLSDADPKALHPAVVELTCNRHIKWSPSGQKSYSDSDVEDFLRLCGVPDGHLFVGHTPIGRETGWEWVMGPRNTVIFAAGRELGYARLDSEGARLIRVGRSSQDSDDSVRAVSEVGEWQGMRQFTRWESEELELQADSLYRFDYSHGPVGLVGAREQPLEVRKYADLPAAAQDYYGPGFYLIGQEQRNEVLALRRDQRVLLGGPGVCQGVRFFWPAEEFAILGQLEDGEFELRPLRDGLRLKRLC